MKPPLALCAVALLACTRPSSPSERNTAAPAPPSASVAAPSEPSSGTLESLLAQVRVVAPGQAQFELFVPSALTFEGQPIEQDAAMVLVLDQLVGKGLFPAGFEQQPTGRRYRYTSTPPQ